MYEEENIIKKDVFSIYEIYSNGEIFRKKVEIIRKDNIKVSYNRKKVKSFKDKDGYLCVSLMNNGKQKTYKIHRLIAEYFIENQEKFPCVNHKDGNKENNSLKNLEWCSYSQNNKHAYKNKLKRRQNFSTKKRKIKAKKENQEIFFDSIAEASKQFNCNKGMIIKSIKNNKKYKGMRWYYV